MPSSKLHIYLAIVTKNLQYLTISTYIDMDAHKIVSVEEAKAEEKEKF